MGFVDSMKDFFGKGSEDYEEYEEYEELEEDDEEEESERERFNRYRSQTRRESVVNFNEAPRRTASEAAKEITVVKIKKFDEAVGVADILKAGGPVIFDVLEMEDTDNAKRVVDFISGVVCGIGGCDKRVSGGIFMATPPGMTIKFEENLRSGATKGKWSMTDNN